jgi:hypothetical protein
MVSSVVVIILTPDGSPAQWSGALFFVRPISLDCPINRSLLRLFGHRFSRPAKLLDPAPFLSRQTERKVFLRLTFTHRFEIYRLIFV